MKTEIINTMKKDIVYPCLMISELSGMILLVEDKDGSYARGAVLDPGESEHRIGEHSSRWDGRIFKPFEGKIMLSNDF